MVNRKVFREAKIQNSLRNGEKMRKTKIICTIGPASGNEDVLRKMILAGMNVARLNFSHSTHADHAEKITLIKKLRKELDLPVAILIDTKGIEIRLRAFEGGGVFLKTGDRFTFTTKDIVGNKETGSVDFPELCEVVKKGGRILVDDGLCEFLVLNVTGEGVECEVLNDGEIKDNKSVNLPGARLNVPFLSQTDKEDLIFGIEHGADFFALSFTRSASDVNDVKDFLKERGCTDIELIAKIENSEGVENIDEIIDVTDGVMVARGDMGVEIPFEELPYIQKKIIKACYTKGKTAIVATQMLESMISNPRPTRAEITDVANAVYDSATAVMLSAETSVGKYPVESIETLVKITERTEEAIGDIGSTVRNSQFSNKSKNIADAISYATCATADNLSASSILAVTLSGATARLISRFHPQAQIIGVTPFEKTYYQLAMSWGVTPVMNEYVEEADELIQNAVMTIENKKCVNPGDLVVIAGNSRYSPAEVNSIQVYIVPCR